MKDFISESHLAAAAAGWEIAHNEMCELGPFCSRHQPLSAEAQKHRAAAQLLLDQDFAAARRREVERS